MTSASISLEQSDWRDGRALRAIEVEPFAWLLPSGMVLLCLGLSVAGFLCWCALRHGLSACTGAYQPYCSRICWLVANSRLAGLGPLLAVLSGATSICWITICTGNYLRIFTTLEIFELFHIDCLSAAGRWRVVFTTPMPGATCSLRYAATFANTLHHSNYTLHLSIVFILINALWNLNYFIVYY